ncbi:MAG: A/G-specific adenine glycosylase [Paludibacteraceae bacterium]|nr:A/G-specific adenine glycosylase [Paludibacteraceae bacterium]
MTTWYDVNHRILPWRETRDPYKIWISEIILQQTRVDQGMDYYLRFVERFPDVQSLAAASEDEVLRLWQGLGYYSRARNLHKAAQYVVDGAQCTMHDGASAHSDKTNDVFPDTFDELRQLPGVGDYTAGAIAAFAYDLPHPALDGNVYRVLARLTDSDIAFDTTQGKKHFHRIAEELLDRQHPRQFDSAIMEFGALYCVPQHPDCEHCPLQVYCQAYQHNTVDLLPVRKPRPKVRDRYLIYTLYIYAGKTLIHQRMGNDIWKHLWEFPLEEVDESMWKASKKEQTKQCIAELTHQLSHQRLHARFLLQEVKQLPEIAGCKAVDWCELDDYALSRLTLRATDIATATAGRIIFPKVRE